MFKYTKRQIEEKAKRALKEVIEFAGDQAHLARMIDVTEPAVTGWVSRGKISKKGALLVHSHPTLSQKFTAEQLRPDINI